MVVQIVCWTSSLPRAAPDSKAQIDFTGHLRLLKGNAQLADITYDLQSRLCAKCQTLPGWALQILYGTMHAMMLNAGGRGRVP